MYLRVIGISSYSIIASLHIQPRCSAICVICLVFLLFLFPLPRNIRQAVADRRLPSYFSHSHSNITELALPTLQPIKPEEKPMNGLMDMELTEIVYIEERKRRRKTAR